MRVEFVGSTWICRLAFAYSKRLFYFFPADEMITIVPQDQPYLFICQPSVDLFHLRSSFLADNLSQVSSFDL